jgi:hypothetical protein
MPYPQQCYGSGSWSKDPVLLCAGIRSSENNVLPGITPWKNPGFRIPDPIRFWGGVLTFSSESLFCYLNEDLFLKPQEAGKKEV